MVETYLIIYALGTITIILATILGAKAVKRKARKPVNIWEGYNNPTPPRFQAPPAMPIAPPPPHFFNNR